MLVRYLAQMEWTISYTVIFTMPKELNIKAYLLLSFLLVDQKMNRK